VPVSAAVSCSPVPASCSLAPALLLHGRAWESNVRTILHDWWWLMTRTQLADEAMKITAALLLLSDQEIDSDDADECLLLEAVLKDSAFKIRRSAERLLNRAPLA
jgi:hypothetical protein